MKITDKINVFNTLQSICFIAGGILCIAFPQMIIENVHILAGCTVIIFGILEFITYFIQKEYRSEAFALAYALITVLLGILFLCIDLKVPIAIILAIWVLISSIFKLVDCITLSVNHCTNLIKYADAFITLGLGVLLLIKYPTGLHATLIVLGIYLLFLGIKPAVTGYVVAKFLKNDFDSLDSED